jgi:hypothetical protein
VLLLQVQLGLRVQRARQLVPQHPAHAAPDGRRRGGGRAVRDHLQARPAGALRGLHADGDVGAQLAHPQQQLVDELVQQAGVGVHQRRRKALAHADAPAAQPVAAGGERGVRDVGQVEHLAPLWRRVLAQAQHVLRGHAGLAGALHRVLDRRQAAHQAGLQPVQARELLVGGVQRGGHFLAQLAHHVLPGRPLGVGVGAWAAAGDPGASRSAPAERRCGSARWKTRSNPSETPSCGFAGWPGLLGVSVPCMAAKYRRPAWPGAGIADG